MEALAVNPMSPESLILAFGLAGVLVILFAETGLLVGFFLPGDSLLFLAGVTASGAAGRLVGVSLPIEILLVGAPIAATAGSQLGHYLGASVGRRLLRSPQQEAALRKAEEYFNRFGLAKALILSRFVGVVRTFINPAAGMLGAPARTFLFWNFVSAVLWTDSLILVGYFLGDALPRGIDAYLLPIVLTIMLISLLPLFAGIFRVKRRGATGEEGAVMGLDPGVHKAVSVHIDRIEELGELIQGDLSPCQAVLTPSEAMATAKLLDMLNDVHPGGVVGDLTKELSGRIHARLYG